MAIKKLLKIFLFIYFTVKIFLKNTLPWPCNLNMSKTSDNIKS